MGDEFRQMENEFWQQVRAGKERHQQEVTLHIFLPLGLSLLIALAFLLLSLWGQGSRLSAIAALATIWLILPILCLQAVFLVLLIAAIYGLTRMLKASPGMAIEARVWNYRFQRGVRRLADRAVEPILKSYEGVARIKAMLDLKRIWKSWNSVGGWNEHRSTSYYEYEFYDYE